MTYGVKVKLKGTGRARWLKADGTTTGKLIHATRTTAERAADVADDVARSNLEVVEWARAEAIR